MKHLRYAFEGTICALFLIIFKLMPLDWASGLGGFLTRNIGPYLATSRKADRNLQHAMPELDVEQRKKIIKGMWDNLGRVFAEYPHIQTIAKKRITFENDDIFETLNKLPSGALFIGAHLGNWEICAAMAILRYNLPIDITYRPPNNPYVDRLLNHYRTIGGRIQAFPKSAEGGRKIMASLKNKGNVAILLDQKYNEGLPIPFFGRYAMTNPIAAQLSQRYNIPQFPAEYTRIKGAHFRLKIHPPLETRSEDGTPIPLETVLAQANSLLESWIRQHPEQWVWMHKRWDSQKVKELEGQ
jgi:Kdo2-lipid IVA lauroyltransferase/acyltransferase